MYEMLHATSNDNTQFRKTCAIFVFCARIEQCNFFCDQIFFFKYVIEPQKKYQNLMSNRGRSGGTGRTIATGQQWIHSWFALNFIEV